MKIMCMPRACSEHMVGLKQPSKKVSIFTSKPKKLAAKDWLKSLWSYAKWAEKHVRSLKLSGKNCCRPF